MAKIYKNIKFSLKIFLGVCLNKYNILIKIYS